jgi:hypothetical protein
MLSECGQGTEDLLRMIRRLQDLQRGDPAKRAACSDLLAKLLPYLEHPPDSSPAAQPGRAGHTPAAQPDRHRS